MKLEIGPGDSPLGEGWEGLSPEGGPTVQHIGLWGEEPLPFEDDTVEEFYASHVIEHIAWYKTQKALDEAFRVIKPGGLIELHTVNFEYVARLALSQQSDGWNCHGMNPDKDPIMWAASRIFAYEKGGNPHYWHKALFTPHYMRQCLTKAGFTDIKLGLTPRGLEKHGRVNLGASGRKPK